MGRIYFGEALSDGAHFSYLWAVFFPERQPALAEVVLEVQEEFLQAGAGPVGEF